MSLIDRRMRSLSIFLGNIRRDVRQGHLRKLLRNRIRDIRSATRGIARMDFEKEQWDRQKFDSYLNKRNIS
jgi:hypothetical protein